MHNRIQIIVLLVAGTILVASCSSEKTLNVEIEDPLSSWNDGETKATITTFVSEATNPQSENFIEVKDRIATFDDDGNLWSELRTF